MTSRRKTQAMRLLESRGVGYEEIIFPEDIHEALVGAAPGIKCRSESCLEPKMAHEYAPTA